MIKFGDIAREVRETFKGDKTGVPVVGLENLIPGEMELNSFDTPEETTFTKSFHKGQILFGRRRAYQKKSSVATFDGICSGDITVIEAIPGKVYPELLPFIIANDKFFDHAIQGSAGSLSPRVKWEHLSSYELELPPIEDQKVLADKLWAAYRLKEAYQRLLAATDEMVKSQFLEMFGCEKYGWKYPTYKISSRFKIGTGGTPDRKKGDFYGGDIPWVKSTEVNFNEVWDTEETLNNDGLSNSNCKLYDPGAILLAMYGQGATRGRVAKLCIPATVNQAIAVIQVESPNLSEFVYNALKVNYNEIREMAVGGNQHNLNLNLVGQIQIPDAPIDKIASFNNCSKQADKSKFELRKAIAAIDEVIKSLING